MLVHVRVVCDLQKDGCFQNIKFWKKEIPNSKKYFEFDHLLVADETDIGVAESTFVRGYKL